MSRLDSGGRGPRHRLRASPIKSLCTILQLFWRGLRWRLIGTPSFMPRNKKSALYPGLSCFLLLFFLYFCPYTLVMRCGRVTTFHSSCTIREIVSKSYQAHISKIWWDYNVYLEGGKCMWSVPLSGCPSVIMLVRETHQKRLGHFFNLSYVTETRQKRLVHFFRFEKNKYYACINIILPLHCRRVVLLRTKH